MGHHLKNLMVRRHFEEEGLYAADTVPAEFRLSRKGGAESPEYGFDVEAELEPDKLEIVPLRRTRTKGLTLEGGTQLQREARDSMSSPTGGRWRVSARRREFL